MFEMVLPAPPSSRFGRLFITIQSSTVSSVNSSIAEYIIADHQQPSTSFESAVILTQRSDLDRYRNMRYRLQQAKNNKSTAADNWRNSKNGFSSNYLPVKNVSAKKSEERAYKIRTKPSSTSATLHLQRRLSSNVAPNGSSTKQRPPFRHPSVPALSPVAEFASATRLPANFIGGGFASIPSSPAEASAHNGDLNVEKYESILAADTSSTQLATAGLAVFMFSLAGVIFLFLLFYFISRLFGVNSSGGVSGSLKQCSLLKCVIDDDDTSIMGVEESSRKFNLLARQHPWGSTSSQVVLYPRRIYELQAEEGCYAMPPMPYVGAASLDALVTAAVPSLADRRWLSTADGAVLANVSGYTEQSCWMNTILLGEGRGEKTPTIRNAAIECGRQLVRKLTGIESPLTGEKLDRIQRLRNESNA